MDYETCKNLRGKLIRKTRVENLENNKKDKKVKKVLTNWVKYDRILSVKREKDLQIKRGDRTQSYDIIKLS